VEGKRELKKKGGRRTDRKARKDLWKGERGLELKHRPYGGNALKKDFEEATAGEKKGGFKEETEWGIGDQNFDASTGPVVGDGEG